MIHSEEYFRPYYGVFVGKQFKPELIRIRVIPEAAAYLRSLPLIVRDTQAFDGRYVEAAAPTESVSRQVGQQLAKLCTYLYSQNEQEWSLTAKQKSRLAEHLSTEYKALIGMLGENFHSAVVRMAVQIERIAMILTAMRMVNRLNCTDQTDYTD